MAQPPPFVLPDFLNLGVAPQPPRGATAFAPRAKLVPQFTLGDPFPRTYRATQPLLLYNYLLPVGQLIPGWPFQPPLMTGLWPNPYSGSQ